MTLDELKEQVIRDVNEASEAHAEMMRRFASPPVFWSPSLVGLARELDTELENCEATALCNAVDRWLEASEAEYQ